ncbi:integral membrane protein-like protein [Apiospora kogelbergensis]|uniref:Efficient mitochondria targeting-associated protein 19 n=1 Tax=Apiospora kogelbergensis TaxID=1337665 RepID=A0AAW0QUT9_9PEZI
MGATSKLNTVYVVYFIIHIPVLFCVDLVAFYPPAWYAATGPLAPLGQLRAYYLESYKDQFFQPSGVPSFFALFAFFELVFHLPVSVWAVRALGTKAALTGKDELLLFLYGVETALTTVTCMWEAYGWDEALITGAEKVTLIGGLYGSYFVVALVLTIDMWMRLAKKLEAADKVKKAQ